MSYLEDYEAKRDLLTAIPSENVKILVKLPMSVYIQEAENLYQWCCKDKRALMEAGLSWSLVEDLPVRCGALREAQARWSKQRLEGTQAVEQWKRQSKTAFRLKKELQRCFRFAFHGRKILLRNLQAIAAQTDNAGMIQGLNDLSVLGRENSHLLSAVNVDLSLLDEAARMSKQTASILAVATNDRLRGSDDKDLRDRAYTHLKEAVEKIRRCGCYVFRDRQERVKGYRSRYLQKMRGVASVELEPETIEQEPEPVNETQSFGQNGAPLPDAGSESKDYPGQLNPGVPANVPRLTDKRQLIDRLPKRKKAA